MTPIKINSQEYEVPDEVYQCMDMLRTERDRNYNEAKRLENELNRTQRQLDQMHKKIRMVSGILKIRLVSKADRQAQLALK